MQWAWKNGYWAILALSCGFFILFGEWVLDFKSANLFCGSQQLPKDTYLREGVVCLAFRLWEVWDAVRIAVPRTKAGSGQRVLLLAFGLLSDHTSRVAFFPSFFFSFP